LSRSRGDAGRRAHASLLTAGPRPRARLAALDRLGEPVVVTPPDGRPSYANGAARDLAVSIGVAFGPGEVPSPEAGALGVAGAPLPPEQRPTELTRRTGRPCDRVEIAVPAGDGALRRLAVTTRRTTDDGPPYGVVTSYALVAADDPSALRQARALFSTTFEHSPIGLALVDPTGRWLLVNQALCDLVGYSETELLERTLHDITHPDDVPGQLVLMRELLAGRRAGYRLDKRYLHGDGHVIWASISVSLVRDDTGEPLHLVTQILDITARHHTEQRLQHLADHDPLTGVLNRRRFEEELIRQLDRCRRYDERATLVMLDLDFFKDVNDGHGHAAGDEALQTIAAALLAHVRSSDILARVGGDEFAALLLGVGADQAAVAAAGLAAVVRELDGTPSRITASVGATALQAGDHADAALLRADEALYRVKSEGRDGAAVAPAPPRSPVS
jgi:diguanylate cyclase (GGDEF)-like protein/PAS domain S-box-containing protein